MDECRTHLPAGIETTAGRTVWCRLYDTTVPEKTYETDDVIASG